MRPDLVEARLEGDLRGAKFDTAHLRGADLCGADLRGASLVNAILYKAHLVGANLVDADLVNANLVDADLESANLERADLSGANLVKAKLCAAILLNAKLVNANSLGANLERANLGGANLGGANLARVNLSGANLEGSQMGWTNVIDVDLRSASNLDRVIHHGPSEIGFSTLRSSMGQVPRTFLKGCGLADWEIAAAKLWDRKDEWIDITDEIHRLRGEQPIQINPLFVSYSHADVAFVEMIEPRFDEQGIRFWRDVHDLKAGRLETQIDRAIRLNPTVLLVLSKDSVESDWVQWEVRKARELEKELGRDVLCPVALDEAWESCRWPERLQLQVQEFNVLDFSAWQDAASFERQFGKLLDGLKLFYRREEDALNSSSK